MEEYKQEVISLLQEIMNSREGCCGIHHIYTPQLGVNRIKNLYAKINWPPNTQIQTDAKPCEDCINYKHNFYGFSFCPKCGLALHD